MFDRKLHFSSAARRTNRFSAIKFFAVLLTLCFTAVGAVNAQTNDLIISVSNPSPSVTLNAAGQSAFFQNAGFIDDGFNTPISLRATIVSISAGDTVSIFRSGDNPVVRANTGSLEAEVLWEVFNRNTGAPISGNPGFLITDIDGNRGNLLESVSAQCMGLTSYTTNGLFVAGVNANNNNAAQSNIRITEANGTIRADGTQGQNGNQQEGYMQFNWTDVDNWVVSYFATSGGRWFVHDADEDIPFDGTQILIDLVDLATIKSPVFAIDPALGSARPPRQGESITWTVELSNAGPADATGANITDNLPANVNLVSATSPFGNIALSNGNRTIDWSGVDIPVGASRVLTIVATITGAAGEEVTNETNTAQADQSKCSSRDMLESTFIVDTPVASLSVDKTAGTPTTALGDIASLTDGGDTITYSYVVENTGNVTLNNVVPVDAGPRFGNNMAPQGSLGAFSPASVNLNPGDSQTFTAVYTLAQDDVDNVADGPNPATGVNNTATATATVPDLSPTPTPALEPVTPSTATTGFDVTPNATITKSVTNAGSFSGAGDTINYSVTIENTGNIELTQVRPRDDGPTINGAGRSGVMSAFTPNTATLAPGESQTFTATYTLSQNDVNNVAASAAPLTSIDNQARIEAQSRLGFPSNIVSTVVETGFVATPAMTIVKSVTNEGSFNATGDVINYQWLVQNTGDVSISNVQVNDAGPTFNGQPASNNLQSLSPSNANLAPGQSQTFTANYTLSQTDINNISAAADPTTAIDNTSQLTGSPLGGVFTPVTSNTVETGFSVVSELTLSKSVSAPTTGAGSNSSATDAGDSISYIFTVTNSGDLSIDSIAIDDTGPTFNAIAGTGSFVLQACNSTTLAPNQSTTCSALYTLSQGDVDNAIAGGADSVDNSATATGQDPNNASVTSDAATAETTITSASSISLSKTAGTPTIANGADATITDPNDTVDYQLLVTNTGNSTLNTVDISDSLAAVTCPALTDGGVVFTNGTSGLAPSDSITCTATYSIQQADINAGQVLNTASVSSLDPGNTSVNATDMETVGFTQRTSVSLLKTAGTPTVNLGLDDSNVDAGDQVTYTFVLTNTGNVSLSNAAITDPAITTGFNCTPAMPATLAAGESLNCTAVYTFTTDNINDGETTNTAMGSGEPAGGLTPPTASSSATVITPGTSAITLSKVAGVPTTSQGNLGGAVDLGDTVSYTFTVENTGTVTLSDVELSDPSIVPGGANLITCPLSVLPAGASMICNGATDPNVNYALSQVDINAGQFSNTATVTGTPPVPASGPGLASPTAMSSATVTLPPTAALTVVKTASALAANVADGDTITYSYLITNSGNVTVSDVLPVDAGPTFNGSAASNTLGAFTPTTPSSVLPISLEPNTSQTFTSVYVLSQDDIDNMASAADPTTAIDNSATAIGTPANGALTPVTPSTVETGVAPMASVTLLKSSTAPAVVEAGQNIDYSFTLANAGNVTLSSPQVSDALCAVPSTILDRTSGYVSGDSDNDNQLDVGESWVFACSYPISQADIDAGNVQNTAVGSGQDPAGNNVSDISGSAVGNDIPTDTPLAAAPAWEIDKTTGSTPARAGDVLVYNFELDNTGNISISNVAVTDAKCASNPVLISGDNDNNTVLSPDEVWLYTCTSILVTQAEIDAGSVDNTVTATGDPARGTLANAADTLLTPVTSAPAIELLKRTGTSGASSVFRGINKTATDQGDSTFYLLEVTNTGNVTLDNIVINDPGPTFNGVAGQGFGLLDGCNGSIAPGETKSCGYRFFYLQADVDNAIVGGVDAVENTATATASPPSGLAVTSAPSTENITIEGDVSIAVEKTATGVAMGGINGETIVGDAITYAITATNDGNTTLDNVTVADTLAGVAVSCPANTNENALPFSNGSGTLPVGESVTCTAIYSVTQDDLNAGQVINQATATGGLPASTTVVDALDEVTTPLTQNTSILLGKSATVPTISGARPDVGQVVTYTFTLENTGNVSLTSPQVTDPNCVAPNAPSPVLLGSGFITGDTNEDGILDAGETFTFSCDYTTDQDDFDAGGVTNVATGTGTTPVNSGLPNPSSTATSLADLQQEGGISLVKRAGTPTAASGATRVGDTIDYEFDVTNTGNVTLSDIAIDDPTITGAPNSGVVSCLLTELTAGQSTTCSASYTVTQADIDAGSVMNDASVIGTPPATLPPTDSPEGTSSASVGITPAPNLQVTKSASVIPTTVLAGDSITYTFLIENTGNVTVDNIQPIDTGPSFNGLVGSNALGAFAPTTATLSPGDTQTFTASYVLSQADLDAIAAADDKTTPAINESATAITNTATADGEPRNGLLPVIPNSEVETGLVTDPEITLIKTSTAPSPALAGSNIDYRFELQNTGNVTISSPTVTDAQCGLPAGDLSFTNGFVSGDAGTIGALDVGETWVFTCSYALLQSDIDAGTVQNTATANGLEPGGDLISDVSDSGNSGDDSGANDDPSNTPLVQTPSWKVVKSTTSVPVQENDVLTYSFVLDNTGNVSISGVSVADAKCASAPTLISGDTDANNILAPDEVWTYSCTSIAVTQTEVDAGQVDNNVSVSGTPAGGILPPAVDALSTPIAANTQWNVVKSTASVPTAAGDTLIYDFVLNNTGNVSIGGVAISDAKCAATPTLSSGDLDNDARIDPNETWVYSCTSIAVTQAEVDAAMVDNNVVVSGSPPTGVLDNAEAAISTPIAANASLVLDKSASAASVGFGVLTNASDEGDTIVYSFDVENNGNVTVTNLSISDLGITFNGFPSTNTLGAITCPITDLSPAQTTTCTATYTLSQTDVDNAVAGGTDSILNFATAEGDIPGGGTTTSPGSAALASIVSVPSLELVKTAGAPSINVGDPAITDPGDTIDYTILVSNTGNTVISNVVVSDTLTTVVCPAITANGELFVNASGVLQVGDSVTCTANYIIEQADLNTGEVLNIADVAGVDGAGTAVNANDDARVGFTQRASLNLVKRTTTTLPSPTAIGNTVNYFFDVENTGNVSLTSPSVVDANCPAPNEPTPVLVAGVISGDTNDDGILDSGETFTYSCDYIVTAADIAATQVINTATASATPPAGLATPSSTAGLLVEANENTGISVDKVAGLPTVAAGVLNNVVDEGDTVTFTINVKNEGNTQLDNIVVTDPLITGAPNNGTIACPFSSLNPSLVVPPAVAVAPFEMACVATYTLTQADIDNGSISNTAGATGEPVTAAPITPPSANSGAMVNLPPMPSLEVVKSASTIASGVEAGDQVTYSYDVTNTGNVTIADVVPVDVGPTFNGAAAVNSLSAFTPTMVDIAPNASQTFTASYTFDQVDIDNMAAAANPNTAIDNSANAIGTPSNGNLPTVPSSQVETGVAATPAIELIKTSVAPTSVLPGQVVTYTFALENTGNVSITNPTVADAQCQAPGSTLSFGSGYVSGDAGVAGVLDVDEVWNFECTYPLSQSDIDAGTVQNTAQATGQDPAGNDVVDTSDSGNAGDDSGAGDDPTNTPLASSPSWNVVKSTASTPNAAGDSLLYNFVVTNTGNVSISSVAVSDAKCATVPVLNSGDIDANDILAPTEIWSYSCTSIGVTQTEVDEGDVDNNVSVTGTPPSGLLPPAINAISTPIIAGPSLALQKTAADPTVGLGMLNAATDEGDQIAFSFAVQNDGNVTIDSLVVNESAPGTSFNGVAGTGALSAIACPATSLAPAQSTTCTATYTLTQADIDNALAGGVNSVENTATVTGLDPSNTVTTSPPSTATTTIVLASDIEIVKTAMLPSSAGGSDPAITDPNDTIDYSLVVTNTGNTTLTSVTVNDSLATVSCLAFVNGAGTLAPGASATCTAQIVLDQDDLNAGSVLNIADVVATDPTLGNVTDTSQATTSISQKTSVVLTKTSTAPATSPPTVGEQITYTFTLQNTGNVSLTNPNVVDPMCPADLSAGVGFIGGDTNSNLVLDANETWSFSCAYSITQDNVDDGDVANMATGSGTPPVGSGLMPPSSTASALAVLQQSAGISLDKVGGAATILGGALNDASDVGDTIEYTFTVANTGNVTLTNITVADATITDAPNNGSIVCVDTTLVSQAAATPTSPFMTSCTASYTLTQADVDAGMVMNDASISADPPVTSPPLAPPSGSASVTVPIQPAPELSIIKSASVIPLGVTAGSTVTYSYLVTNEGNVTISDVTPIDSGPSFNGVAGTNSLAAFAVAAPATLPVELAPGASQIFTADYILSQADIDNMATPADPTSAVDNTATATGTPANGVLQNAPPSTVETGVQGSPSLALIKSSVAPSTVVVGSIINYSFSLQNTGNVTIDNPVIDDAQCQSPGSVLSFSSGYASGDAGLAGQLDVGETWRFNCSYAITQTDIDAGTVQNSATATGQDPGGRDVSDVSDSDNAPDVPGAGDADPTNTPLDRVASWTVAKATNSAPTAVDDVLDYTFIVSNTGNVSISGVVVSDDKCAAAPVLDSGDADGNLVLTPNEVWTFSCTSIAVTQDEADAAVVNNNVSVSGVPPLGTNLADAVDSLATPLPSDPQVSVIKSASAPTIGAGVLNNATDLGDTIEYSFLVSNDGNVTLSNLVINDLGQTFNGVNGSGVLSAIVCPVMPTLLPTQSTTCTATYTLSQADIDNAIEGGANTVENIANVTMNIPGGGNITSDDSSATTTIASLPSLSMTKTANAPSINLGPQPTITDPGDTITYRLVFENTGNATLSSVTVTDDIADSITCAAFNNGVDSLAPGAIAECEAVYTLQQSDFNIGSVTNMASVEGVDPFNTLVAASDQITSGLTQRTSILLNKSVDSSMLSSPNIIAGDTLLYNFTLQNTGNVTLESPQVDDPMCPNTPLVFGNGYVSGDIDGSSMLEAGETWNFSCTFTLDQPFVDNLATNGNIINNSATGIGSPPISSGLANPSSTAGTLVDNLQVDSSISLEKMAALATRSGGVAPNTFSVADVDTIAYTFKVVNTGSVTLNNIVVSDPLITNAGGIISCPESTLNPIQAAVPLTPTEMLCTASYTITQTDLNAASVSNTAMVTADAPTNVPPPSGSASAMVALTPAPILTVTKAVQTPLVAPVTVGSTLTYSYTISNQGNVTINDVSPVDVGPTFNNVAGTNSLSAFDPLTVALNPNDTQVFTATYALSQVDIDNMASSAIQATAVNNTATATGTPVQGNLQAVTPSSAQTGIAAEPSLELIKTSTPPTTVRAGALLVYDFALTNNGNVTISSPTINDALCQLPSSTLSFSSGYLSGDLLTAQALDVGETWNFRCSYAITQADIDSGTVRNEAVATGQQPNGEDVTDQSDSGNTADPDIGDADPTFTPLEPAPGWNVVKSTNSTPLVAGDILVYEFLVSNTGNVSISSPIVTDLKCSAGAPPTLVASTDIGADGLISPAALGAGPVGEQWTFECTSIPVQQAEVDAGVVSNTVIIDGTAANGELGRISDTLDTEITRSPMMSLVKTAGQATLNGDGAFDQAFSFELRNVGNVTLTNATVADDFGAQFGTCFDSVIDAGTITITDAAPAADSSGAVAEVSPNVASASQLAVGDSLLIVDLIARFNPNATGCVFASPALNSATSSANSAVGAITDVSDPGPTPDLNTANNLGVPTEFTPPTPQPEIGIAKSVAILAFNDDFSFDVEYTILIQNTGDVNLTELELFDDLVTQFGAAHTPTAANDATSGILQGPVVTLVTDAAPDDAQLPILQANFTGDSANIFDGSSGVLGVGDVIQVVFSTRVQPANIQPLPDQFENIASVRAKTPSGTEIEDLSNEGSDPGVGAGGPSSPTIVTLEDVANLPIVLGRFVSTRTANGELIIQWQTQTEVANLGFNLYRRVGDSWSRLNDSVIPAHGDSVQIVDYEYRSSSEADTLALSDIDAHGKETLHGPFVVGQQYGKAPQRQSTEWLDAIQRREHKQELRELRRRQQMRERNAARKAKQKRVGG